MPYGGGYSGLSSKNNWLNQHSFIKNPKRGAILIEFAFAVPVLFSLIYYIQDLATIKRWHSKLDFSLHCAANMFQNTPNITRTDFARIAYASVIGMFGDPEHNMRPFRDSEPTIIHTALCVTGIDSGTCKVNWFAWSDISATKNHMGATTSGLVGAACSRFRKNNVMAGMTCSVAEIDPSLSINIGETKIIMETSIWKGISTFDYDRRIFGLHLAKVSPSFVVGTSSVCMNHSIIFTPKPGTFDPEHPPQ